jgi:Ca2+-binding EF-hand superfamily protein
MSLAEELRSEIDEVFRMFDDDDSGSIDVSELASALYTITGEHIPREETLAIMQRYDRDHSGAIDRTEFETMVLERMRGRSFQEETSRAFKLLEDPETPGYVTRESVRKIAQEAGEKLSDAELAEMFDVLVTGQMTPAVDFATFCSIQYAAEHDHQ